MAEILTAGYAVRLGMVLDAIGAKYKVRWTEDEGVTIREGTLRSLVRSATDYTFLLNNQDVRDANIWITTSSGLETTLPVRTAVGLIDDGGIAFD